MRSIRRLFSLLAAICSLVLGLITVEVLFLRHMIYRRVLLCLGGYFKSFQDINFHASLIVQCISKN